MLSGSSVGFAITVCCCHLAYHPRPVLVKVAMSGLCWCERGVAGKAVGPHTPTWSTFVSGMYWLSAEGAGCSCQVSTLAAFAS